MTLITLVGDSTLQGGGALLFDNGIYRVALSVKPLIGQPKWVASSDCFPH